MILAIPILSGAGELDWGILIELGRSIGVLAIVLFVSRLVVTRLLDLVARTRQRDLFVLSVFVICLGTAWILSRVGLPLALGAFLAGLVVAGSAYRHQALSDLIPFREVLTSLFFVSVGMFIDPLVLARNVGPVLSLLAAIVLGKFVVVSVVGTIMRLPTRVTILSATALAQVGEFSFVLLSVARQTDLLDTMPTEVLSMAIILSMLITPIAIASGRHVAAGVGKIKVLTRLLEVRSTDEMPDAFEKMRGHVIVAGYGVAGKELAYSLEDLGFPYVVVDLNPENVRDAIQHVVPAYFGDITSPEVLEYLGAERARELVIAVNDPDASKRAIRAARQIAPELFILVRTQYVVDVADLLAAGANEVVASELEASAEITSRVLARHRVAKEAIDPQLERIRHRTDE
jgi:CPA2 family monovalent cation:H+ antiporter-2